MLNLAYLLIGIGLLAAGGEALIRGALGAAKQLGISPLLSGLLIVGCGTSMPELVVSIDAVVAGRPDLAIGNVVGSNIANILLVLGLCAIVTPLTVSHLALRRDALMVIVASVLFIVLAADGSVSFWDAAILLLLLVIYLVWAYRTEKLKGAPAAAVHEAEAAEVTLIPQTLPWCIAAIALGLATLVAGSKVLLAGAVGIAQVMGVSEAVIGLTLVAVGTSLPELTISLIAAFRQHADVAIGNALGSNLFNLLGILGVSALVHPMDVAGRVLAFDQWIMLAVAFVLLAFLLSSRRLSRIEGAALAAGYVAYVGVSFSTLAG